MSQLSVSIAHSHKLHLDALVQACGVSRSQLLRVAMAGYAGVEGDCPLWEEPPVIRDPPRPEFCVVTAYLPAKEARAFRRTARRDGLTLRDALGLAIEAVARRIGALSVARNALKREVDTYSEVEDHWNDDLELPHTY